MTDDMENKFQRRSGVVWPREEEGKGELGISSHFLNVVGKKVEGNEISVRREILVGFWKKAWLTW